MMLTSIPGLSPLDVHTLLSSVVTAKKFAHRHCHVSPGGTIKNPCGSSFNSPPTREVLLDRVALAKGWAECGTQAPACLRCVSLESGAEAVTRKHAGAAGALISVSGVVWSREPAGTLEGNPTVQGITSSPHFDTSDWPPCCPCLCLMTQDFRDLDC